MRKVYIFDETNPNWQSDNDYNKMWLSYMAQHLEYIYKANGGIIRLNKCLAFLGLDYAGNEVDPKVIFGDYGPFAWEEVKDAGTLSTSFKIKFEVEDFSDFYKVLDDLSLNPVSCSDI